MPPSLTTPKEVCPELVRSTFDGPPVAADRVGTSFAAPKVSHIVAALSRELPGESCLLYRALVVQSARLPSWATSADDRETLPTAIRCMGYGLPNLERALGGNDYRVTLATQAEERITAKRVRVYQVKLPDSIRSPGDDFDILVEVTLSYKAEPRRTRRHRRKYLSTWLDWEASKVGEDPDKFLDRLVKDYTSSDEGEEGEGLLNWTLGKRRSRHGRLDGLCRSNGTIQKDWTFVKPYNLRDAFCIAVIGHEGWNNSPNAEVPYSLVVSFEIIGQEIPIYTSFVEAQALIEVQQLVQVSV